MWAEEQRARHKVAARKKRRGYPTDISDENSKLVELLLPGLAHTWVPQEERRQVMNAPRYLVSSDYE